MSRDATSMVTTLSKEDDLDATWDKVIKRLEQEAELKLPADRKVDDVLAIINPPKADPGKRAKIKDIFSKALMCIDRFGSMVAQAGSVVFGPSTQVYNAVSFLIRISQDVQEVFDNVTLLMTRLTIFLERLDQYFHRAGPVKVDYQIRGSVYRVLEKFISVMVLSYKLTHQWKGKDGGFKGKVEAWKGRVKVIVKVGAFGDDSGVKAAIDEFEQAVADVSDVQIDDIHRKMGTALLTLDSLSATADEIHSDTQALRADTQEIRADTQETRVAVIETATVVEKLRNRDDEKKTDSQIRKVIGFGDKDDLELYSRKAHEDYHSHIEGMGSWLLNDNKVFEQWQNIRGRQDVFTKILLIQAPEGYGKSYISHTIIDHLQKQSSALEDPLNMRVAYHYFPKDGKPSSFSQALRYIVYQFASKDSAYGAFVKSTPALANPGETEVWSKLVMDYSAKRRPAALYYIILDGVDRADQKTLKTLEHVVENVGRADDPEGLRIRLLLTGTRDSFQSSSIQSNSYASTLDLEPHVKIELSDLPQIKDIQAFISDALSEIPLFKGTLTKDQEELKAKILEKLPTAAPGDYNDLNRRLAEIKTSEEAGQIEELVNKVDQDSKRFITDQIEALNETLSGTKIRQINEALMWVSAAKSLATGKLLQSMIDMVFEGKGLISIVGALRKDCKKLLDVGETDDDSISFKADAEGALQKANAIRATVNETEINMIQAMLQTSFQRTFGDYDIYRKFDFSRFFDEKRKVQTDLIHLPPPPEVALRVLDTCLRAICDVQGSEKTKEVRTYANANFDEHLVEIKIEEAEDAVLTQCGRRLFRMLREEAVIDTYVEKEELDGYWNMLDWFTQENNFFDSAIALFKNADVQRSIEAVSTETDWLYKRDFDKEPKPLLLQHIIHRLLQRWYDGELSEYNTPIMLFRLYFWRTGPYIEEYKDLIPWCEGGVEELERWETWALTTLGPPHNQSNWERRMGNVFGNMSAYNRDVDVDALFEKACARCKRAIELDPANWDAQLLLGTILTRAERWQDSADQLIQLKERTGSEVEGGYDTVYWEQVVPMISECYFQIMDFDKCLEWDRRGYEREIAKEKRDESLISRYACGMLAAMRRMGKNDAAAEFLRTLNEPVKEGFTLLQKLLQFPSSDIHDHIVPLSAGKEMFDAMTDCYASTIKDSDEEIRKSGAWTFMCFRQWKLLWHWSSTTASQGKIIDELDLILDAIKSTDNDWTLYTRRVSVKQMANAVFRIVQEVGLQSDEAKPYITRLESVGKKNDDLNVGTQYYNANFILARLLHLSGEKERARSVLRKFVRNAVDMIRDKERDARLGYEDLALILPVLDDDVNARAAWSLLSPNRPESDEDVDEDADAETDGAEAEAAAEAGVNEAKVAEGGEEPQGIAANGDAEADKRADTTNATDETAEGAGSIESTKEPAEATAASEESGAPNTEEGSAQDGDNKASVAEPSAETLPVNGQDASTSAATNGDAGNDGGDKASGADPATESEPAPKPPKLEGVIDFICDGPCSKRWLWSEEMYVCKDCLCVQLDPGCYAKLRAGELDVDVCSAAHTHLHIPPFDEEAWRASDPKLVRVGEAMVDREKWLYDLEVAWDLHKWDAALLGIHKFKLRWLERRKRKKEQEAAAATVTAGGAVPVNGEAGALASSEVLGPATAMIVPEVAAVA